MKRRASLSKFSVISLLLLFSAVTASAGTAAFTYDPIPVGDIVSAAFSVDFAALTAHRYVGGDEVNYCKLIGLGGSLPDYDLSDDLFGTEAFPDPWPTIDMGPLETGWVSADIDSSFFAVLATGEVGLDALFTDTDDAMFAVDFISLTISGTGFDEVISPYGYPVGNENNGFGIDLPDGGDLPAPLPDSIPAGSTGTGFDECISSKSIHAVPEPTTLIFLGLGSLALLRRKRNTAL